MMETKLVDLFQEAHCCCWFGAKKFMLVLLVLALLLLSQVLFRIFFVSISLWHFEVRPKNLMLQNIINLSLHEVCDRRFLNHDKKLKWNNTLISLLFSKRWYNFLISHYLFFVSGLGDYSEVRIIWHLTSGVEKESVVGRSPLHGL